MTAMPMFLCNRISDFAAGCLRGLCRACGLGKKSTPAALDGWMTVDEFVEWREAQNEQDRPVVNE